MSMPLTDAELTQAYDEARERVLLLGQALGELVVAVGQVTPGVSLTGPQLLVAAEDAIAGCTNLRRERDEAIEAAEAWRASAREMRRQRDKEAGKKQRLYDRMTSTERSALRISDLREGKE